MFDPGTPTPPGDQLADPAGGTPHAAGPSASNALPRRRSSRRADGLALVLVGALVGGSVGFGAAHALTPRLIAPAASAAPAGARTADTADQAAITDLLRRANQAQAEAFAAHDPTLMRATATDAHYRELVSVNDDLAAGGVTRIELLDISFGAIAVQGDRATATTIETWRSTYRDGTTDQRSDQNDYTLVRTDGGWKVDADTQPDSGGGVAPAPRTSGDAAVRSTSRNWSGYVATGATYTAVAGTWTVPTPDPAVAGTDATWVGIGGASSTDLIQAGTGATVAADGTVQYEAWTETLPQSTRTVALAVHGGDTVTVRIAEESSGLWRITIANGTTGQTYATTLRYASTKGSAEWIEEAPSIGRGIAPLDRFGTIAFRDATTVAEGATRTAAAAGAKPVTMTSAAGQALAVPSALGADGGSFSVSRTTAASGGPTPGRRRG